MGMCLPLEYAVVYIVTLTPYRIRLSIGIVLVEVVMLVVNGLHCPLTPIAARYTDNRRAKFDIYLPEWLARHTRVIFGWLYAGGIIFTLARWVFAPS
jgi:hypothetical protein